MWYENGLAFGQRDDAVVHQLQQKCMQIDKIAWNLESGDLPASVSQKNFASGQTSD